MTNISTEHLAKLNTMNLSPGSWSEGLDFLAFCKKYEINLPEEETERLKQKPPRVWLRYLEFRGLV